MKRQIIHNTTFLILYQIVIMLLFTVLLSCTKGDTKNKMSINEITKLNMDKKKKEVKNTLIAMWNAIEQGDIDKYATYIHNDFTQFGENDTILRIGKEAEVNGINDWIKKSSNIHTEMIDPIITINGNVAWIVYYWSDNGTTDGKDFNTRGKSTRIFVKQNGNWLCIHGHYTLLSSNN